MTDRFADETMVQYLLNDLKGPALRDLEEQLIESAAIQEHVAAVEADLVEDYVAGRLAPALRARFETQYLSDPIRARKVEFARQLRREVTSPSSRPRRLTPAIAGLAAMLVLSVSTSWLAVRAREDARLAKDSLAAVMTRQQELSARLVPSEERTSSAPPSAPAPTFMLVPGASRALRGGQVVTVPTQAQSVTLELRAPTLHGATYRAVILTPDGEEALRADNLVARRRGDFTLLALSLDPRRLRPGDYVIRVSAAPATPPPNTASGGAQDVADYPFRLKVGVP